MTSCDDFRKFTPAINASHMARPPRGALSRRVPATGADCADAEHALRRSPPHCRIVLYAPEHSSCRRSRKRGRDTPLRRARRDATCTHRATNQELTDLPRLP
jgi:hypothetical protein